MVAIVPDQSAPSAVDEDFGANDWLLEEMYEQYTADPSSVDEAWVAYFSTHGSPGGKQGEPGTNGGAKGTGTSRSAAPAANGRAASTAPAPRPAPPTPSSTRSDGRLLA